MNKSQYKTFFNTLGNVTRLEIINALRHKPLNVTQLVKETGHQQSTISHSVKKLESCHFVTVEQRGQERFYALNEDTILPLLNIIDTHVKKYCDKNCTI